MKRRMMAIVAIVLLVSSMTVFANSFQFVLRSGEGSYTSSVTKSRNYGVMGVRVYNASNTAATTLYSGWDPVYGNRLTDDLSIVNSYNEVPKWISYYSSYAGTERLVRMKATTTASGSYEVWGAWSPNGTNGLYN